QSVHIPFKSMPLSRSNQLKRLGRLILPLLLVGCASTPELQAPLQISAECQQRLEAEAAAEFPSGADAESMRSAELDSVLVRNRDGRNEAGDTARVLDRYP